MKKLTLVFGVLCTFLLHAVENTASIYQISTMSALRAGVFDAQYKYRDVMKQGSLGVGVIENINGEMVAVDGHYYHILPSGKALPINPDETCPFARVVQFTPETHFIMQKERGWSNVTRRLLQQFSSLNVLYAVKIQGVFPRIKVRVLREMKPPYSTLANAQKEQNEFTLYDIKGTIVGFYTPSFLTSAFDDEFDFSFISSDMKTGGHVLDFSVENVNVLLQPIYNTQLILPTHLTFHNASIDS